MNLTYRRLLKRLSYNPDTGIVTNNKTGKEAGWLEHDGYRRVSIFGKNYQVNRLVVMFMTGNLPKKSEDVHHINKKIIDNRWKNLEIIDRTKHSLIEGPRNSNKSGYMGVSFDNRDKKWRARLSLNGIRHSLGYHNDSIDAAKAVVKLLKNSFPDENWTLNKLQKRA